MSAAIFLREARQSWRGLLRRPGYLLLAVATLALGVATSTAVFALIDQALLRPLPFPESDRLVTVGGYGSPESNGGAPAFLAPARAMQSVESVGIARTWATPANVARGEQKSVVKSIYADRGFLDTLGLPLAYGRNFDPTEDMPGGPQAVIVSYGFWQRFLGADPKVVGQSLELEGRKVQLIGVMSPRFQWPDSFDLIMPLQLQPGTTEMSFNEWIIARLKKGVSLATASQEAKAAIMPVLLSNTHMSDGWRRGIQQHPPNARALKASVFAAPSGNTLWMFLGAAGCVLLIALINIASLMVLRSLARRHDVAVRAALGGSWFRLASPAFSEGLLIGFMGSIGGILLAWLGLRLLGGFVPPEWLRGETVAAGPTSLLFAITMGLLVATAATALSVARLRSIGLTSELIAGGRTGWSRSSGRLGRTLVVAQVALAVVLLTIAALFARSLQKLEEVPMGFQSKHVSLFDLAPLKAGHEQTGQVSEQARRVIERLEGMPGIDKAGVSTNPPTASQLNFGATLADGRFLNVQYRLQSPGFLDVFEIPLLAGRALVATDQAGSERVCLVSQAFVRKYFDGQALGQLISMQEEGRQVPMRV
ncbi:MAG: ABC transporter permease, partial [Pseudoxanthomonas sp.]